MSIWRRKSIIKSRNCKHGYINAVLGVEKITNRRGSDGTTDHLENVMNLVYITELYMSEKVGYRYEKE